MPGFDFMPAPGRHRTTVDALPVSIRNISPEASFAQTEETRPADVIKSILSGTIRRYKEGQHILLEGERSRHVLAVHSGLVRCFRVNPSGRRHISRFAGPGAMMGLEFGAPARYSAEAVTDCELLCFGAGAVSAAAQHTPHVGRALMDAVFAELADRERAAFRLARLASDQRLADFILQVSEDGRKERIHLDMSRMDLADHLGLTLETVSRSIHRLKRLGLISLDGTRSVRIPAWDALQAFLDADPSDNPRHNGW